VGVFAYPLTIIGPEGEATIEALVDTAATYSWIPEDILRNLGVQPITSKAFSLADGRVMQYQIGPITARIDGEEMPTLCIFGDAGTEPLLGAMTLEAFLLAADPYNKKLVPVMGHIKSSERTCVVLNEVKHPFLGARIPRCARNDKGVPVRL